MSKVYEYVTENIISKIEESIKTGQKFQWIKPWTSVTAPRNFITKQKYKGINLLLLSEPGFYVTFKQLNELKKKYPDANLKLKEGSKAHMVVFWTVKQVKVVEEDKDKEEKIKKKSSFIFKYYNVFNQKDIENFESIVPEDYKVEEKELEGETMDFINFYSDNVCPITYKDRDRACYNTALDKILIPPIGCFKREDEFYSTCFHEMTHSTGHSSRLDRKLDNSFGDEDYSKEELIAEIGANILCATFGVQQQEEQTLAYLQCWIKVLKNDVKLIAHAGQNAEKATSYMLELYEKSSKEKTA